MRFDLRFLLLVLPVMLSSHLTAGCAARTNLEPVGKGNIRVGGSVGGPLVYAFGIYPPIPNLTAVANYGLGDRVDLNGNLYLLPIAYSLVGLDLGATWYPVLNNGAIPTIGVQARLMAFASFKSDVDDRLRAYPILSSSAAWRLGEGMIYTGADLTVPLTEGEYDSESASVILSPLLGYRWELGRGIRLYTELKWHGANIRSNATAEYINPGGYGAISPYVAFDFPF